MRTRGERTGAPAAVVSSRRHALVARARRLAEGLDPTAVLLDGPHLVATALDVGWPLEIAAVSAAALEASPELGVLVTRLGSQGVPVMAVTAEVMAAMSPVRTPSGLMAVGARREASLDETLSPGPALVLVACDIQDPGNLGALVRSADACEATGVACAGSSADPFGWKALRGAMGSTLRVPVVRAHEAAGLIGGLRQRGLRLVATAGRGGHPPEAIDWTAPTAILVGNEGRGLPPAIAALADARVSIPMRPGVESMNVSVAAGILLYEARRQRHRESTRP